MNTVKGYENFKKDQETSVVVNTNMNAYVRHMKNKQNIHKIKTQDSKKLLELEQQIKELKELIGNK